MSSLQYVLKLIDNRISKIGSLGGTGKLLELFHVDSVDFNSIFPELQSLDNIQLENVRIIDLSIDQLLKNNVALSYFIDFMSSQGQLIDLFFYLNIEGKLFTFIVL